MAYARQMSLYGAAELQQENYSQAEAHFSDALRRSPADERAHWGMAEVHWERGERELAVRHMQQAAQLSGGNPEMHVRLGEMHLEQGNLVGAMENAQLALGGNRQSAAAWALKGQVLRRSDRLDDAIQCYHRALISQPDNPDVQIALAEIYRRLGRPQRALATLDRMSDLQSESALPARAYMLRGQALADLGELREAQVSYREAALCCSDSESGLLLELAQAQLDAGELAEARHCLGRAMAANPNNPQALAMQADLNQKFERLATTPSLQILPAGFGKPQESDKSPPIHLP